MKAVWPASVTMVARHGKVVEFDAAGKRDIASNAPMQKDSIFRIYSMSKPITGVAMMILFEEGKWQLNDPVAKYIPEFANLKVYSTDASGNMVMKDQNHPVTMRELMSHSGGFTLRILQQHAGRQTAARSGPAERQQYPGRIHQARRQAAA